MSDLKERLAGELQKRSEAFRNLPPTERDRLIDAAIVEFLDQRYEELEKAILARLAKLPPVPGKDDSWSW